MVKLQNRKETAQECNLPYEYKTMRSAVIAHFKHLKELGQKINNQHNFRCASLQIKNK
jgi:hypothetical protein